MIINLTVSAASNMNYNITVRGYPLNVFCEWGQNGAATKTFMNLPSSSPAISHWGGSNYAHKQPLGTSTRTFQKGRLVVDKCFLAINKSDRTYSVVSGAALQTDWESYGSLG